MPPKSRSKTEARGKKAAREETPEETPEEFSASEDAQTPELDPYELLDVKTDATQEEIKTAYKKLALKHHPDKVKGDKDEATKKFQELTWGYAILSDEKRREIFDKTGSTEAAAESDERFNWTDFCNTQYQSMLNLEMLEEHKIEYQESEQEREELLSSFVKHEGDLDRIFEDVVFSNVLSDETRFRSMIDKAIADGKVEGYKAYTQEPEKKKQRRFKHAQREAEEAEVEVKKVKKRGKNDTGEGDLAALIKSRQSSRMDSMEDLISRLEDEAKERERPKKRKKVKA